MSEHNRRQQTFSWESPLADCAVIHAMNGYEYLSAMKRGEMPGPPIGALMNMEIQEVEIGRVVFQARPAEYHYNPLGAVHGGFAATLLDSAMACAINSTLPAGVGSTTLELHINYVRALSVDTGIVYCEGKVIHVGRSTATSEGRLTDADGKLYAHGTTTCLILGGK